MLTKFKLIKTVGGTKGLPLNCHSCGSSHFFRMGMHWQCMECKMHCLPSKENYRLVGRVLKSITNQEGIDQK